MEKIKEVCPYCNSDVISSNWLDWGDGHTAEEEMYCLNCGKTFYFKYDLQLVDVVNEDNESLIKKENKNE